ncbi:sodium channel protein Nach [Eurytemora carolleeae]|uniref:sodium channel protein Nach n=1 Tax=Eurytemora carolleeae TaxID=1294199 RepID=UPI000C794F60|nr:sodium channel protein Nach [Eurytemora carolleeae]|eukprot:XP_023340883.1 sodium channel protein Nach-like [Eurytemora affinis]
MSVVVPTEKSRKVFDLDVEDDDTDKKPGMGAVAKAEFEDYMANATIACLRFIVEDGIHWSGKVLWVVLQILISIFFIYMLLPILQKYSDSPIIISVETTNYNIANIKFPGVTVCSNFRISNNNFKKTIKKTPWKQYEKDDLHQLVTNLVKFQSDPELIVKTEGSEKIMVKEDVNISSLMSQILPNCERMFLYCKWQGKQVECKDFVQLRKTDSGFCCSFNTINIADNFEKESSGSSEDEDYYDDYVEYGENDDYDYNVGTAAGDPTDSAEEETTTQGTAPTVRYPGVIAGYEKDTDNMCLNKPGSTTGESQAPPAPAVPPKKQEKKETVIFNTNLAGPDFGFTFNIDPNLADEFVNTWDEHTSTDYFTGFKVLIHSPDEFPEVSAKSIPIHEGTETFIALSAQVTKSTESVQSMSQTRRSCLLENEVNVPDLNVNLNVFKSYSQANCLLECQAAATLSLCNCLMYYYPKFPKKFVAANLKQGNNSACTFDQLQCLVNKTGFLNANVGKTTIKYPGVQDGIVCDCPDDCDQTMYTKEITSAPLRDNNNAWFNKILCLKGQCTTSNQLFKKEYDAFSKYYNGDSCVDETFEKKLLKNSLVHVYFKDLGVTKFSKDQLFGWVDILALVGGTFGLCNGFCLLSGFEILYYLFLHRYLKRD